MLSFDRLTTDMISISNGIGQGNPSSMILYLIYSHVLVAIPALTNGDRGAYVDDNFVTAQGEDFMEHILKINTMLNTQERWSTAHNSHVELSKFKCLCLTCHTNIAHPDFKQAGSDVIIKCVSNARLLRVEVNQELHW